MTHPLPAVDIHTHILPREWPDMAASAGYGGWPTIEHAGPGRARIVIDGEIFREITSTCWDPARRLEECDRAGVRVQVLSTVPVMFRYRGKAKDTLTLARYLNDHIASVVRDHPDRFVGLGTLPMQDPDLAIGELDRCVRELGLAGVQIGTHVNEWNLDSQPLFPVFARAAEIGAAVFVHPWEMMGSERMPRYFLPWLVGMPAETAFAIASVIFGGVLERLPTLRMAFAHGGGSFPFTLGRMEHGFHVRPDLCQVRVQTPPRAYIRQIYVDSLVHDADALRFLIKLFGADRIALGSDYPFPLGEAEPGGLIRSLPDLSKGTRGQLLSGTALAFLGVRASIWT